MQKSLDSFLSGGAKALSSPVAGSKKRSVAQAGLAKPNTATPQKISSAIKVNKGAAASPANRPSSAKKAAIASTTIQETKGAAAVENLEEEKKAAFTDR